MPVERGIQINKVREKTTGCHLAGILIKVVIAVGRQITHAPLLFPDLNRKDGSFAVAHPFVSTTQDFADDATPLGRGIRTVVHGTEHHLIPPTGMDGIHIVDKGFHSLMHPGHSLVHRMLEDTCVAGQAIQRTSDKVVHFLMI